MGAGRWKQKLTKFGALSRADKWMLLHATVWLALARLVLFAFPFRRLAAQLSREKDTKDGGPDAQLLERIGYTIRTAAANVPWRSDCFPQSITGWMLLKHHGYASKIHLGVERTGNDELAGHAWLTCGNTLVIGGEDLDRFTEMLPL